MSLELNISGIEKIKQAIAEANKKVTDGLNMELDAFSVNVNRKQVTNCPVDTGVLRGALTFDNSTPLDKKIFTFNKYAPYQEFGTGGLVEVPAGLEEIAVAFKGKGVRKVNMPAQPFFFRAFFEEKPTLMKNIENLLNE